MNKKEKIIAILFSFSMLLVIVSAIYTLIINKPADYSFAIEKMWINIASKFNFL